VVGRERLQTPGIENLKRGPRLKEKLRLRTEGTSNEIFRRTAKLAIAKRTVGSLNEMRGVA
jgi:hypothetical protein